MELLHHGSQGIKCHFDSFLNHYTTYFITHDSHFACFDGEEKVLHMKERAIFTQDLFGLKTLRQRTKLYTVTGVTHHQWHQNPEVIDNCIIPHLD